MATHSSALAWKIPWTEEPGRLQSMGLLRVGHNWATSLSLFTFHFHALEKEMATHSSVLAWRIPGTGEPGGLPSLGSHRVRHNWSDLAAKDGEALYSQQKQDQDLTVAQLMNSLLPNWLKLKTVGKTTRPFRYDLNQIPYDHTVGVTNRFKGLDLIECLKNYRWRLMTLYRKQWSRPSPGKRSAKKAKWLSEEAL